MYFVTTTSGVRWHYDLEGEGPAVLFIHGWGVDMRIWRQQFKYFSRSCQVLSIDLPGHGQSSWQPLTLGDIARDFYEIIHRVGMKQVAVVASSFGGLVALQMVDFDPAIFRSLVLVGSPPKFLKGSGQSCGLTPAQTRKLASQLQTDYPDIIPVFFRSLFTDEERESRRFKWIQTFRKTDAVPQREALLNLLQILEAADLRRVLKKVKVPTLVVSGQKDYFFPEEMKGIVKKLLPRAQFREFADCGHFPFLTQSYEFNGMLEKFFQDEG